MLKDASENSWRHVKSYFWGNGVQNPNALLKLKSNYCLEGLIILRLFYPVFEYTHACTGHLSRWFPLGRLQLRGQRQNKHTDGKTLSVLGIFIAAVCSIVISAAVILQMESSGLVLSVSHPLFVNTYIPFKNKIVRALNTNVRKLYYLKGSSGETMSNT